MITKHSILKMVRHIVRRDAGHPDRRIMHPARDWFIGLLGVGVVFLGGGVYAGYLFWSKSNTIAETHEATSGSVKYDRKLIDRVLTDYRARQTRYESLGGGTAFILKDIDTDKAKSISEGEVPPVAKEVPLKVE